MTTDQIVLGVGLTVVLAVGSQILATRLRIPALIVLLPVGFTAGALTDDVNPQRLLGPAFSPLVSLAVAVILYDAGLGLDLRRLTGHTRRVVVRLIWLGVLITWGLGLLLAEGLFDMSHGAAVMLGAVLVVSGPTVVGPLLGFVRPVERLQHILAWEGSLIDPVGGILGALVFHAVVSSTKGGPGRQLLAFAASVSLGVLGGAVGAAVLWLLLTRLRLPETLGTAAQLATVIGVAAVCDALREDTGLIAAVLIGLAVANSRRFDVPSRSTFFETLVQLILGLLFISISATIAPASIRHLGLPTLGFIAALVLAVRPLVAAVATLRTDLSRGERSFVGWMAPRGIVAAASASTFSSALAAKGVGGAEKILPVTFLVIVGTVTLYGFTAEPVARWLGVQREARSRPLLVGGEPWVVDFGLALRSLGLDVLMWAGPDDQRARIRGVGLELAPGELFAAATGQGAELEGITSVLLLTAEDDFNILAGTLLRGNVEGPVYRLGPARGTRGVVSGSTAGDVLFSPFLARTDIEALSQQGATVVAASGREPVSEGCELLCRVRADGVLAPVTQKSDPEAHEGDTLVLLRPPSTARTDARPEGRATTGWT